MTRVICGEYNFQFYYKIVFDILYSKNNVNISYYRCEIWSCLNKKKKNILFWGYQKNQYIASFPQSDAVYAIGSPIGVPVGSLYTVLRFQFDVFGSSGLLAGLVINGGPFIPQEVRIKCNTNIWMYVLLLMISAFFNKFIFF